MEPEAFRGRWAEVEPEAELVTYSRERVVPLGLAPEDERLLVEVGLPRHAAPHLGFKPDTEWSVERGLCLGGNGAHSLHVQAGTGQVRAWEPSSVPPGMFVNASIGKLAETLLLYRDLVEEVLAAGGPEAWRFARLPEARVDAFAVRLRAIDPGALADGSFWQRELSDLRQRILENRHRGQGGLRALGVSERGSEEPRELGEITLVTDATTLRALAEFFQRCVHELDQRPEDFSSFHVHLRDTWKGWGPRHPDIVVNVEPPVRR